MSKTLDSVKQAQVAVSRALAPLMYKPLSPGVLFEARALVRDALLHMERLGQGSPEIVAVVPYARISPSDPSRLDISCIRDTSRLPWTEQEFEEAFRRAPELDDLERINCHEAGEPGHLLCGQCPWCFYPGWECRCAS